jgi:hypothetical protein
MDILMFIPILIAGCIGIAVGVIVLVGADQC